MSRSQGLRYAVAVLLFTGAMVCLDGAVGNLWAASFRDSNYQEYVRRGTLLLVLSAASLLACVIVLVGRWVKRLLRRN